MNWFLIKFMQNLQQLIIICVVQVEFPGSASIIKTLLGNKMIYKCIV